MHQRYDIPELGINGDLQDACRALVKLTWNYNHHTQIAVNTLITSIQLPEKYIGLHIRRGDKSIETNLLNTQEYMDKAKSLSELHCLFISTDDYQIIEDLKTTNPDFILYTLCDKNERGYFHEKFRKQQKAIIKSSYEKLFASVDLLNSAKLFIGTFSSNVGMFLGMRMPKNLTIGIDPDKWVIW
jgi:hypothetical protein